MKIKHISIFILLLGFSFACDDFEEMNVNPNEPTEVSADVLLPATIRQTVNSMVLESFLLGNNAAQLTAKTLRTEVGAYNWNAFPTVWEEMYGGLTDIYVVEEKAIEEDNQILEGVAIVWKSYIFSVLTNAYGDIPYSEAIQGDEANLTPVYDAQEEIYTDLLSELERAETLLASGNGEVGGDILLGGDANNWLRFANSLRLRLLMYASNSLSSAPQQIAQIVQEGNYIQSNAQNVALTYLDAFPNQFPLIPQKTGDFDAVAIGDNLVNTMTSYGDPRLARYARPNNGDYDNPSFSGAVNGSNSPNCNKGGSRLGAIYYNYPDLTSASSLGLPIAQGLIMTYSEVEFILAEAAAKGWITDDVETHYRAGIEASMDYYDVEYGPFGYTDFNDYYANSGVAYDEVIDIWEQKWMALFFTGLEPYFEVRRWYAESGMSFAPIRFLNAPCENLNNDVLPMRFLYPGEEQSLNSANYSDAVDALGGSNSFNAPIWIVE